MKVWFTKREKERHSEKQVFEFLSSEIERVRNRDRERKLDKAYGEKWSMEKRHTERKGCIQVSWMWCEISAKGSKRDDREWEEKDEEKMAVPGLLDELKKLFLKLEHELCPLRLHWSLGPRKDEHWTGFWADDTRHEEEDEEEEEEEESEGEAYGEEDEEQEEEKKNEVELTSSDPARIAIAMGET